MKKSFIERISDITRIHRRAAFADVPDRIAAKETPFETLARERYSCRAFKDTPLTDAQVEQILEAARLAPTAANKQPVHVWAVRSPEGLEKLKGATAYTFGAPAVFMVGARPDAAWVRKYDGKNGADVDAAIVGTHIMLEASALGLGNVWVGSFDPAKIKADFPATDGYEVVCLFPVGVPAAGAGPKHAERLPMEAFASEL